MHMPQNTHQQRKYCYSPLLQQSACTCSTGHVAGLLMLITAACVNFGVMVCISWPQLEANVIGGPWGSS